MGDLAYRGSFVQELISLLFGSGALLVMGRGQDDQIIEGDATIRSDVGERKAHLRIYVDGRRWSKEPPMVVACVNWLRPKKYKAYRDLADWHRTDDGQLCWIRPDDWHLACKDLKSMDDVQNAAACMAKNVLALLQFHHIGDVLGLNKWPPQWEYRPHGSYKEVKNG